MRKLKKILAAGFLVSIPIGFYTAVLIISGLKVFLQVAAATFFIIALSIIAAWAVRTLNE